MFCFPMRKKSKTKLDSEADLPLASRVSKRNSVSERSERPTLPETGKQLLDRIIEERNKKLLAEWEEVLKKMSVAKPPYRVLQAKLAQKSLHL